MFKDLKPLVFLDLKAMFEQQKPMIPQYILAGNNPTVKVIPAEAPENPFLFCYTTLSTQAQLTSGPERFWSV